VCILAMLNLIIQCLFIVLIRTSMLDIGVNFADEGTVKKLMHWRVKFAHAAKYADEFTNTPLAQSVCDNDLLNMEGSQQAALYRDVNEYLTGLAGLKAGEILCMLVVMLWSFTCLTELMACSNLFQAVWLKAYDSGPNALSGFSRLRAARSSISMRRPIVMEVPIELFQKTVEVNLSFRRVCAITCCSILPRFCVLIVLGYFGVRFLVATTQLEELMLNAVVLEIVLHVDEFAFDLFAPDLCKRVLLKTHPFRLPKRSGVIDRTIPYFKLIVVATMLRLIRVFLLEPILKNLEDAKMSCAEEELISCSCNSRMVQFWQESPRRNKRLIQQRTIIVQSCNGRACK